MDKLQKVFTSRHKFFIFTGLLISTGIVLLSAMLATYRTSFLGRAQSTSLPISFSRNNSYLFASPVAALADGDSIIRITVFLLDTSGLGIEGARIVLQSDKSLYIKEIQPITDSFGRAIFDVTSKTAGDYKINAQVEGVSLPQTVSISFH